MNSNAFNPWNDDVEDLPPVTTMVDLTPGLLRLALTDQQLQRLERFVAEQGGNTH